MGKRLAMLFIIISLANLSLAAGYANSDREWGSGISGRLYRSGTLTNGEYMVKAIEFQAPVPGYKDSKGKIVPYSPVEPSVSLEIYKNGSLLSKIFLNLQNDYYIDPDYELRVSATGFLDKNDAGWVVEYYNPWAEISIQKRGRPKLDVSIGLDPDKTMYYAGEVVLAEVTITNNGEAFAQNVEANLKIDRMILLSGIPGELHQSYDKIETGDSRTFKVRLSVPDVTDEITMNLIATTRSYDVKDLENRSEYSKPLVASVRMITLSKAFRDRIYLKDSDIVRITVANSGTHDAHNIHVRDALNENFELTSYAPLQWDIPLLKPGEERSMTYIIRPLSANINGFTIPAAHAQFTVEDKQYDVSTTTGTLVVNGPQLVLNKAVNRSVVNVSDDITVSVVVSNVGNAGTTAEIDDSLPDDVTFINGSLNLPPTFMEANTNYGFSYVIRMENEGNITLPPFIVNYTDVALKGTMRLRLSSNTSEISVVKAEANETRTLSTTQMPSGQTQPAVQEPSISAVQKTPGFDATMVIFVGTIAAALICKYKNWNR